MNGLRREQQVVKDLVAKIAQGDCDSFVELEGLAKPLMTNLSKHFSSLHYKFEFDDFYSICMNALYEACLVYDPRNPSFLSYSKTFMLRQCWRELEYWNAGMRNIFDQDEISCDLHSSSSDGENDSYFQLRDSMHIGELTERREFKRHIEDIIRSNFNGNKAEIMHMYIIKDMSPKDIAIITNLHYQNIYATIRRGMEKVVRVYKKEHTLDN